MSSGEAPLFVSGTVSTTCPADDVYVNAPRIEQPFQFFFTPDFTGTYEMPFCDEIVWLFANDNNNFDPCSPGIVLSFFFFFFLDSPSIELRGVVCIHPPTPSASSHLPFPLCSCHPHTGTLARHRKAQGSSGDRRGPLLVQDRIWACRYMD
jgi:hypothetical protein